MKYIFILLISLFISGCTTIKYKPWWIDNPKIPIYEEINNVALE